MFKENFVVCIKADGKILREQKDLVYLPFGTEYSILLKNLDTRNVSVSVSIDGRDVLDGLSIVIKPEKEYELKGFAVCEEIKNRFKFIEKTSKVEEYRGSRIDDSFIRVEFTYEQEAVTWITTTYIDYHDYYWIERPQPVVPYAPWQPWGGPVVTYCQTNSNNSSDFQYGTSVLNPMNEEGITVKGSKINERLDSECLSNLETNSNVIILHLKGKKEENGKKVTKPLYTKVMCSTCGRKCRNAKFCPECGTCLI